MIVLTATCKNGKLILDQPIPIELEGEKVKIEVSIATNKSDVSAIRIKRLKFIEWSQQFSAKLPENYKFDREEIYSDDIKF